MKKEPWYPFVISGECIQQTTATDTPLTARLPSKPFNKHVTFSEVDDVTYIYQWSPTKYLLFGKYTDDELRRREKANNGEQTVKPILKKTHEDVADRHVRIVLKEDNGVMSDSKNSKALPSIDASTQLLEEEIIVEETSPKHPILPSMAIFSPNESVKELISNSPIKEGAWRPVKKKRKKVNRNQQQLTSNFTLIGGDGISLRNEADVLPKLASPPATKPSEATVFGSVKNVSTLKTTLSSKYFKMPSIGIGIGESVRSKPLIKTQITQRYSLDSDDLDDIQWLTEEAFHMEKFQESMMGNTTEKRTRRPLPLISDVYTGSNSTFKKNRTFFSSLSQNKSNNATGSPRRGVCDTARSDASAGKKKLLLRSCKQEVYLVDEIRFPDANSSSILSSAKK